MGAEVMTVHAMDGTLVGYTRWQNTADEYCLGRLSVEQLAGRIHGREWPFYLTRVWARLIHDRIITMLKF
jgi:hypothetical protein